MAISYRDSGVDVERGYKAVELIEAPRQDHVRCERAGDIGSFGGSIPSPAKRWKSPCSSRGRTAWAQSSNTHSSPTSTIPSVSMRWRCASTTSSARARSRCFSSIILRRAGFRPKRWLRSCRRRGGVPPGGLRPHRRGNCGNARLLCGRRVRHRRVRRRHRR